VAPKGKFVERSGVVEQIHIVPGEGMPFFDLRRSTQTVRVYLGPMRLLLQENFNPKAGQEVIVKGYQADECIIASEVTIVAQKRTLRLRDEHGWPVWRGGFGRTR